MSHTRTPLDLLGRLAELGVEGLHARSLLLTSEWSLPELETLAALAELLEALDRDGVPVALFPNELHLALFFDSSTRTRSSWAGAAARLGARPVVVDGSATQVGHGETAGPVNQIHSLSRIQVFREGTGDEQGTDVAVLGHALLRERLTPARVGLAVLVLIGVFFTVRGGEGVGALFESREAGLAAGVTGGLLAALAYAGTTLLARWAVPRYGSSRVLFLELAGATTLLALFLPATGQAPAPPDTVSGWVYVVLLSLGAVLGANYLFFGALKRIEAAPAAAETPVVEDPAGGAPIPATALVQALAQQPTFATMWIGNNDVLPAAVTATPIDGITMTPVAVFEDLYFQALGGLATSGADIVVRDLSELI